MNYKLRLSSEARIEEEHAFYYYDEIRPTLADEFLTSLEECYHKITTNPFLYSFIKDSKFLRDINVTKFPFTVVYIIKGNEVIVLSVRNTHRQPFI